MTTTDHAVRAEGKLGPGDYLFPNDDETWLVTVDGFELKVGTYWDGEPFSISFADGREGGDLTGDFATMRRCRRAIQVAKEAGA